MIFIILCIVGFIVLIGAYFALCFILGEINAAAEAEEELLRFNNE